MCFVVHSIWSCDYLRERCMLRDDVPLPRVKCKPLNIRDLYFGGRTNAIILQSEFLQNSKGGYLDFCSLNPYVLKYERYPIGHPTHFTIMISLPSSKFTVRHDLTISWVQISAQGGIGDYPILV